MVKLHRFTALAETQQAFTFVHPNRAEPIDNSRSARLKFGRAGRPAALCHGFAGYFDACLCAAAAPEHLAAALALMQGQQLDAGSTPLCGVPESM